MPKKSSLEIMIENLAEKVTLHMAAHKEDKDESKQWKSEVSTKIDKLLTASIEQGSDIKTLKDSRATTESILIEHGKLLAKVEDATRQMEKDLYNPDTGIQKKVNEVWDMRVQMKPIIWLLGIALTAIVGIVIDRVIQSKPITYESNNQTISN